MQCIANSAVRYALGVMAQSASDAVQCAGGAIYDWAAAGWDVTVYAPDVICSRAIGIVGARCGDLETLLNQDASLPKVLVITTGLHAANNRVKECVEYAVKRQVAEVVFVDTRAHDAADGDALSRVLGSAARAFKQRAIHASGVQIDVIDPSEHFCRPAVVGSEHLLNSLCVTRPA